MDNNYYNPYTNNGSVAGGSNEVHTVANMLENNAENSTGKKKQAAGFGKRILQTIAIALIFGLVAGSVGVGVVYVGGKSLGLFRPTGGFPSGDFDDFGEGGNRPGNNDFGSPDGTGNTGNIGSGDNLTNPIPETDQNTNTSVAIMDVSALVENAMPSIVAITNISETYVQNLWGQVYTKEVESCGTGFLVEQDNEYIYIATNNHVVEGAKELTVQFFDNSEVKAQIKGQVASKDLAVVKVAIKDLSAETKAAIKIARLGDSNALKVGEGAIAIGNALGYGQSVTTGVVSALGRSVTVTDSTTGTAIINNNLIQTDAAINPGNSGGALFNVKGEVIGINSVKYADTDVEGIGYAIPISDAMLVIDRLISGEQIDTTKAGYLGIQGVDSNYGVYVYKVYDGSAADKAGLSVGDIITEFEGNEISSMSQLKELLTYYAAGEEVEFIVYKAEGKEYVKQKITVTLGDASTVEQ